MASKDPYSADGSPLLAVQAPPRSPNLIVIVVDTLRADTAGAGPGPGVMPTLAALATRSVSFSQASSPSSWTVPSITSLLTGLRPSVHGCTTNEQTPRLVESVITYAEVLRNSYGYETAAFTDAPWFRGSSASALQGFGAGSAGAGVRLSRTMPEASGFWLHGTSTILAPWNAARDRSKPFFLLLHTFDAHDPYGEENRSQRQQGGEDVWRLHDAKVGAFDATGIVEPTDQLHTFLTDAVGRGALLRLHGASFMGAVSTAMWSGFRDGAHADTAQAVRGAYLKGAAWVDDGLRKALEWMEQQGLLKDTLLVVTSDHGEAFAEHGTVGHGHHLYDELVRIPLLMSGPAPFEAPLRLAASVGLIDVLPTFFDWAGLRDIPDRHGRSFLPMVRGESLSGHDVQSELHLHGGMAVPGVELTCHAVRGDRWKYIITLDRRQLTVREELYDLGSDPGELDDILRTRSLSDIALPDSFCEALEQARDEIRRAYGMLLDLRTLDGNPGQGAPLPWQAPPSPCRPHGPGE